MNLPLATTFFSFSLATQAQSGLVKLVQPLPYYKSLRDTTSVPPASQRYPAGAALQIVRTANAHWHAVTFVQQKDVAAYYVRNAALQTALIASKQQLPHLY